MRARVSAQGWSDDLAGWSELAMTTPALFKKRVSRPVSISHRNNSFREFRYGGPTPTRGSKLKRWQSFASMTWCSALDLRTWLRPRRWRS